MTGRVLDLFCGAAGGWSLGMHRAGYRTVAAAESDPWRRAAFLHNNPGVEMFDDVRAVTADALRERLGYLPDIIVGSPPCQDASSANAKGKGVGGARTGLFSEFVRLVREVRPLWCAAENVPPLRTRGADWVLSALAAAGYPTWPLVVGAWHAGAWHRRNRVWIVGARADACDAPSDGWRQGGTGRSVEPDQGPRPYALQADGSDAASVLGAQEPGHLPDGLTAFVGQWPAWNPGSAPDGRVGHGLPKGMARDCLAAYGDAVIPQIPEAIGRVMARLVPVEIAA